MAFSTRCLLLISLLVGFISAQSSTSSAAASNTGSPAITPANSVNAKIYPGDSTYTYYGCYNETTLLNGTGGLRALTGGANTAANSMTVATCLTFCEENGGTAFAGLEYTRECYCATYLSALSSKLPDSSCNLACEGNTTQICGGALRLSVYQKSPSKKGAAVSDKRPVVGSILALGVAVGVLVGWS